MAVISARPEGKLSLRANHPFDISITGEPALSMNRRIINLLKPGLVCLVMITWVIGMSAAGKTVVATELYALLKAKHFHTVLIDGDVFRGLHGHDVNHTIEGRRCNSDRLTRICQFLDSQGIHVVCAVLSIFPEAQRWNRENYKNYFEVFLDVSRDTLIRRDPKGLWKKALSGEMLNMVGVDIELPHPPGPEVVVMNEGEETPRQIAGRIFESIKEKL